ncbi:hypothetical protein [Microvirga sp. Mcv34]|nr:hypothetical protein [Microvirga sp. Mcv34]
MSLSNSRCKAYCQRVEQALWVLMALVIFGLWCFSIFKLVEVL